VVKHISFSTKAVMRHSAEPLFFYFTANLVVLYSIFPLNDAEIMQKKRSSCVQFCRLPA
jgi:hypothetical protein